jgi:hypothetical protein
MDIHIRTVRLHLSRLRLHWRDALHKILLLIKACGFATHDYLGLVFMRDFEVLLMEIAGIRGNAPTSASPSFRARPAQDAGNSKPLKEKLS